MWICHTATPRTLLAMPATCKDVAAATRASGKTRDRQRCCRGMAVGANRSSHQSDARPWRRPRLFERNAQMPTENDRQTWPDTASSRCIPAVKVDRRAGRYRRPRADAKSRAAPQKRNWAPRVAGKGVVIGAMEGGESGAGGRRGQFGNAVVPSARARPTYSLALLIVIAPAGVDTGGLPARAMRGLTPARSP
jgi:hypothetical protein